VAKANFQTLLCVLHMRDPAALSGCQHKQRWTLRKTTAHRGGLVNTLADYLLQTKHGHTVVALLSIWMLARATVTFAQNLLCIICNIAPDLSFCVIGTAKAEHGRIR
jgi:hypothetical protein